MMKQFWTFNNRLLFWLYDRSQAVASFPIKDSFLNESEIDRAANMKSNVRAETFLAARALLRKHLATELNLSPESIIFDQDSLGKPILISPTASLTDSLATSIAVSAASKLTFNVAHSHERILIAIDRSGGPFGVDLEFQDPNHDFDLLARHLYTEDEKNRLAALDSEARKVLALEFWCEKEARFKAGELTIENPSCLETMTGKVDSVYTYAACFSV
jgi:phosphopantetheinyl transferase